MLGLRRTTLVGLVTLVTLGTYAQAEPPFFVWLGIDTAWGGGDVSADGSVVIGNKTEEAFRWTRAHGIELLGVLPGDDQSYASQVLPDGSAIRGVCGPSGRRFIWTEAGGMVEDPVARWGELSDDWTIGAQIDDRISGEFFRWTEGDPTPRSIGRLPGSYPESFFYGISGDGSIVLAAGYRDPLYTGYYWTEATGWRRDLPGGFEQSTPWGASADGRYIVGDGWSSSWSRWEAYRLDIITGEMIGLGDVPGGGFFSMALDASADGSVVLGKSDGGEDPFGDPTAFLWTDPATGGDGMRSLKRILEDDYGLSVPVVLSEPLAISDDGRTVIGIAGSFGLFVAHLGDDACPADCDGDGELTFFDFLCFQNLFAAGDPSADCDGDGTLTFFDFLCFQNAFAAGCP